MASIGLLVSVRDIGGEPEGIFPEIRYVQKLLKQGSQQELSRCAREIYRNRNRIPAQPAKDAASEAQLQEAFNVFRRHARRAVDEELSDRKDQLDQDAKALDGSRIALADAIRSAAEKQRSADELKEALIKEMGDSRTERTLLQENLTGLNAALAAKEHALVNANSQMCDVQQELSDAQIALNTSNERIALISSELTTCRSALDLSEATAREKGRLVEALRSEKAQLDGELLTAMEIIKRAQRQNADSVRLAAKRGNELARVSSKLARERLLTAGCREQLRGLQQQASANLREVRQTTRALQVSERARESLSNNFELMMAQFEELKKEYRRIKTSLMRFQQKP